MSTLTVDERTHQRVLDFLTYRPVQQRMDDPVEQRYVMHAPEARASIAEQTAADLVRFLRAKGVDWSS